MIAKIVTFFAFMVFVRAAIIKKTYYYEGGIIVKTMQPKYYYNLCKISAFLHIKIEQWSRNEYKMQFKEVEFKNLHERTNYTGWFWIPKGSEAIELPFVYDVESKTIRIQNGDLPWSINIKKSVANLFAVDKKAYHKEKEAFHSEDGFDYFMYRSDRNLQITKMMTGDIYQNEIRKFDDKAEFDEPFTLPFTKVIKYDIKFEESHFPCRTFLMIKSRNYIQYSPLNGNSESFALEISQYIEFINMDYKIVASPFKLQSTQKQNLPVLVVFLQNENVNWSANYDIKEYTTDTGALDLSKERLDVNLNQISNDLKKDLLKLYEYLNKSHINFNRIYMNEEEHVDSIINRLKHFKYERLHGFYLYFNDDVSKMLITIISFVGTPISCKFIVNLIKEETIVGLEAVDALKYISKYTTVLPDDVKTDLLGLTGENVTKDVRYQAILTLSNFLSESDEEIIKRFIGKLKCSNNEETQLIYMYALSNIKSERIKLEMLKIAKGEYINVTVRTRAESLYRLDRSQDVEDVLWLIFIDKNECFEIRAAIMNILVTFDRPLNVEKMFWMLTDNNDNELYILYYKKVQILMQTVQKRFEKSRIRATELNIKLLKPYITYLQSSTYLKEVHDFKKYAISAFETTYYGVDGNFVKIQFKTTTKVSGPTIDVSEYHVYTRTDLNNITLDNIFDKIGSIDLDFTEISNGKVLSFRHYNKTNVASLIFPEDKKKIYLMDQKYRQEIFVPSDMGIPIVFKSKAGYLAKLETQFIPNARNKAVFDLVYKSSQIYGFTYYNPVSNSLGGIKRIKTTDIKVGFDVNFWLNLNSKKLKFTINKSEEPLGIHSKAYSKIFIGNASERDVLNKMCDDCQVQVMHDAWKMYNRFDFFDYDSTDTGIRYKMSLYDCIPYYYRSFMTKWYKDMFFEFFMTQPTPGECNFGFVLENSKKRPSTSMKVEIDYVDKPKTINVIYKLKNRHRILKSWHFAFKNDKINDSYVHTEFKAIEFNKNRISDYKLCYNMTTKWHLDHIMTTSVITSGSNGSDKTCPDNGLAIKINSKGENSEEMKILNDPINIFSVCFYNFHLNYDYCLGEMFSYRHYTYNITYDNITDHQLDVLTDISDYLRFRYSYRFVRMKSPGTAKNELKIILDYPIYYSTINVTMINGDEAYRYDDIQFFDQHNILYPPANSRFISSDDGYNEYCEVGNDMLLNKLDGVPRKLDYTNDWVVLSELVKNDVLVYMIKVKKSINDCLIVYIQNGEDVAELSFLEKFELKINGEVKNVVKNVTMAIYDSFDVLMTDCLGIFVKLIKQAMTVEYMGDLIRLSFPSEGQGECHNSLPNNNALVANILQYTNLLMCHIQ